MRLPAALPAWSLLLPIAAIGILVLSTGRELGPLAVAVVALALFAAVIAAVHHAEVVALRVGEPFGTLVLAVAVTVIEVALIVSLMLVGGDETASLPRDTVFAAIMIVCNGAMGLCILVGGLRHHILGFRAEGSNSALAVLAALATLTLVLPTYTTTTQGPTFSASQLVFAGIASLVLYCVFVFVQTVRHRDYFLPEDVAEQDVDLHAAPPSRGAAWLAFALLLVALVAVVGLAKMLAPTLESGVRAAGAPQAMVGVVIALIVLLPETWAAVRAAAGNRLQTSLNLALGSALASIGLTIPAVVVLSFVLDRPLLLGLPPKEIALLALTLLVTTLTLSAGRTTVLQGVVHLVLFSAFLFLAAVP
jgi:Ca2+:H+ antiporter